MSVMAITDVDTLKVSIGPNSVWIADGAKAPMDTGYTVDSFWSHPCLTPDTIVRMLGTERNAGLITDLFWRSDNFRRIELAGPHICEDEAELLEPQTMLFRMRQCALAPSLGTFFKASRESKAPFVLRYSTMAPAKAGPKPDTYINNCLLAVFTSTPT